MIIVVDVVVVVVFVVDEEKPRRKWRKTFEKRKINGDTDQPTGRM